MIDESVVIKIVSDEGVVRRERAAAASRGVTLLDLDLDGLHDVEDLERRLVRTFGITKQCRGLDAVVDLAAEIGGWIPSNEGYLLITAGIDSSSTAVAGAFAGFLPQVLDRLRSGRVHFTALLLTRSLRSVVLAELRRMNDELAEFGSMPTTVARVDRVSIYVDGALDSGGT